MSGQLFPGTDELLMYHSPKDVVNLPPDAVAPFMLAQLDEQVRQPSADFETTLGLGQLARLMKVGGLEPQLEAWLQHQDEAKGHDTAALFLAGYWPDSSNPSSSLVKRLLAVMAKHVSSLQLVETLLLALSAALTTQDRELQGLIRSGFRQLLPSYPLLQTTSQTLLRYGLPIPDNELPKARPDHTEFRAYFCEAGADTYVSIEHVASRGEAVRVLALAEDACTLHITYKVNVLTFNDSFAQNLIAETVLRDLCQDRFRERTSQIEYSNPSRRKSAKVAYTTAVASR